jgi:hypothetical protein
MNQAFGSRLIESFDSRTQGGFGCFRIASLGSDAKPFDQGPQTGTPGTVFSTTLVVLTKRLFRTD